ncbi:MAG: HAMP domain-containing protein [Ilumatobacter sp.]|nr:HAMP domain-containing protein [Ilumatobacter sp.]
MNDADEVFDVPTGERQRLFMSDDIDEIRERAASLPWWRRPRQLRRQLAGVLVATALASVLLVGGLNFYAAQGLLDDGTEDQLVGIGTARARTIENGVERVLARTSSVSGDLGIVDALGKFANDFAALEDEVLSAEQQAVLENFYEVNYVEPYNSLGLEEAAVEEFLPTSNAGRYLQYHYIAEPWQRGVEPSTVVDAGDGSDYSRTHARFHESLNTMLTESFGAGDAELITLGGDIVYSVDKRIDFGTNILDGPYDDSNLADVLRDRLPRVRSGSAVLADIDLYLPDGGRPVFFSAVSIKNETETIGALATEIPVAALNSITTSGQEWEKFGLQSGESYVVGGDGLLRSESRLWIEDRDEYLRKVKDEPTALLIDRLDSPIGIQNIATEPVSTALEGDEFRGTSTNYLGTRNFSYAQPIEVPGVDWVVVVDIPLKDARAPLYDYAKRLGFILLIILPVAALVGLWLARRLTRPIPVVLAAATSIADGERDLDIPDLGQDEFGDLARRLENMAEELGDREAALASEYEDRRELLLAVLPPRLIDESGSVSDSGDLADLATVVAVTVDTSTNELEEDEDRRADLLDQVATLAKAVTADRNIERVRASADGYLYLVGVGSPGGGAVEALDFVADHLRRFEDLRDREDLDIALRFGLATGPVATGVLDNGSLTFGAWGLPVRQASVLAAMSDSNEVLIDASTAAAAGDNHDLERTDELIALDAEPMDLYTFSTN